MPPLKQKKGTPHRPVRCVSGAVRKNGHARTVGPRGDVGIAPYIYRYKIVR